MWIGDWTLLVDVLLVALLLAIAFFYVRRTVLANLYLLIIALFLLAELVEFFGFRLFSDLIGWSLQLAVIALLIVFQPELRKLFLRFSTIDMRLRNWFNRRKLNGKRQKKDVEINWEPVITAIQNMQSELSLIHI